MFLMSNHFGLSVRAGGTAPQSKIEHILGLLSALFEKNASNFLCF